MARTNLLVCIIIVVGFSLTAILGYRANYKASLQNIEQVSDLTSEGIYYQLTGTFTKPVNISLTMANDSLLRVLLAEEPTRSTQAAYNETLTKYLDTYRQKYGYDSVFLVSRATGRYYNFDGLDRVLTTDNPENAWYYALLESDREYEVVVDNDEVAGAQNDITVFVNCKIKDEQGRILGVVGVGMRTINLQALLQSYQSEFGVGAYLVNNDGTIEISPELTGYEQINLFDKRVYGEQAKKDILDQSEAGQAKSFWTHEQDGDNYIVTRYIPELQWHLVVERDTGALVEAMNRQVLLTVLIIVVIVAVILWVITWVIRSFNRQIVTLTQTVEQERHAVFEKATGQLYENIYELDITHNRPANEVTEAYFESLGAPRDTPFDRALPIIAEKQIKEEFRQGYLDTFSPENVLRAFRQGRETLQYDFQITQDGKSYYWMRIIARIVQWENDGSIHMLTYRQNIEAEKQQEQRMQKLAQTDEMTGLLTKSATQRSIEESLKQAPNGRFAFFILDIDQFKQANDRYGHAFGDEVIRTFVETMRRYFRPEDVMGRLGGDEFAAFVPAPDENTAAQKAQALVQALQRTYGTGEQRWEGSASVGVAFSPKDGVTFAQLYRHADRALYQAKRRQRGGYALYDGTKETE